MSELNQKDFDAALIAELLDGPLTNDLPDLEKASSLMRSAGHRLKQLLATPPPPSGDLVERIEREINNVKWLLQEQSNPRSIELNYKGIVDTLSDCLTALQGVTISPECAEAAVMCMENDIGFDDVDLYNELKQALEHSNGR